ncbi:MAG: hypothetical protein P8Z37_05460 [Acidobacteriota bacterium]
MHTKKTPEKTKLISRRKFSIAGGAFMVSGPLIAHVPNAMTGMVDAPDPAADKGATETRAPATTTLEVLNPRGEVDPPKTLGISPRVTTLAGKRIGLYDNGKDGFADFLDVIEKLLKEKYPTAGIVRFNGGFDCGDAMAARIAESVDTVIYGSGD